MSATPRTYSSMGDCPKCGRRLPDVSVIPCENCQGSTKLVGGWISVETCLPDSDLTVLIFAPGEVDDVWMGFHDGECWRAVDASMVEGVTHWMNLPLPPI